MHNTEGYADNVTINPYGPFYYYYHKDHLGNNREVWKAAYSINGTVTPAAVVQQTSYYPSGLPWSDGSGVSTQTYKYNGKEFVEMHGLDTYDYGARGYYPAMGRFMTMDPLAEKYYSISPYAYCAGNPVRYVDIKGQWIKDATGAKVQITYNENGTLSFSNNADANTIRMSNALNLSESGRSILHFDDNSSIGLRMVISPDTKIESEDCKTFFTNGETLQGTNNSADNYGRVVNEDGTFGIKEATITVNEGTLNESIKAGSGTKLEGLTMEQAIGAVAGHESVHGANKGEINKDIKAENSGTKRTDQEVKPIKVEQKIIDEYKQPK